MPFQNITTRWFANIEVSLVYKMVWVWLRGGLGWLGMNEIFGPNAPNHMVKKAWDFLVWVGMG